jgi:hypothetical protein
MLLASSVPGERGNRPGRLSGQAMVIQSTLTGHANRPPAKASGSSPKYSAIPTTRRIFPAPCPVKCPAALKSSVVRRELALTAMAATMVHRNGLCTLRGRSSLEGQLQITGTVQDGGYGNHVRFDAVQD